MEVEADAGSGASAIMGGIATNKITTCLVEAETAEAALKSDLCLRRKRLSHSNNTAASQGRQSGIMANDMIQIQIDFFRLQVTKPLKHGK